MSVFNKITEYVNYILNNGNKKKVIENAVIAIIIGIIIIIAGGAFFGKDSGKNDIAPVSAQNVIETSAKVNNSDDYTENDRKLEAVLSQIKGAGKVSVLITYVSGKEIVPAVDQKNTGDETNEKDTGGGTRTVSQNSSESTVVYEESQGGEKKPVVLKEIQPAVKGVVVVADGANDPVVKENLSRAVQVLVDVPIHKIQVFERGKFSK